MLAITISILAFLVSLGSLLWNMYTFLWSGYRLDLLYQDAKAPAHGWITVEAMNRGRGPVQISSVGLMLPFHTKEGKMQPVHIPADPTMYEFSGQIAIGPTPLPLVVQGSSSEKITFHLGELYHFADRLAIIDVHIPYQALPFILTGTGEYIYPRNATYLQVMFSERRQQFINIQQQAMQQQAMRQEAMRQAVQQQAVQQQAVQQQAVQQQWNPPWASS